MSIFITPIIKCPYGFTRKKRENWKFYLRMVWEQVTENPRWDETNTEMVESILKL